MHFSFHYDVSPRLLNNIHELLENAIDSFHLSDNLNVNLCDNHCFSSNDKEISLTTIRFIKESPTPSSKCLLSYQGIQQPGKPGILRKFDLPQGKPGKPGKLREFFCLSMRIF